MKLIKACFLSSVSLLRGLHAERILATGCISCLARSFDIGARSSAFGECVSRPEVMLSEEEKAFVLAACTVWKPGLWASHLADVLYF